MGNMRKPSADATQALTNLSRVAQDAPYGFIGIANNLNPLLESFQQLSKNSKESGGALKALVGGLTGPAGIGLALGVASSLIVKFGDDIQKFITEKAVGLGKAFTKETELMQSGVDAFVKARLEIVDLNNEYDNFKNGTVSKDEFLKKFNDTLGDTIGKTKDLAEAEKFLGEYADDYVEMTFKKAIANEAAAQAAKKQVEAEIAKNKPQEAFKGVMDFTTLFYGGTTENIKNVSKRRQDAVVKEAEDDVKIFEKIRQKYQQQADALKKTLRGVFGAPEIKGEKSTFAKDVKDQAKILDKEFNKIKTSFGTKKDQQYMDLFKSPKAEPPKQLTEATTQFYQETLKDNQARTASILLTKEQTEANLKLAETLSNYTANAFMNLWSSMEQGMSIGEALGNLFMDLAKQIAAAAIKAAIFQAIMNSVSGGAAAGNAITGGFNTLFKGFLGLASGGIVTKPTLAMVGEGNESEAVLPLSKLSGFLTTSFNAGAMSSTGSNGGQFVLKGSDLVLALQRSNNNLNLRRGV
jgi:hypothetical protein